MQILKTTFFSLALTLGIQIIFFSEFGWAIYRHGTAMLNGKGYILSGESPIPADGYYYSPSTNQTLFYADYVPFNNNSSTVMLNGQAVPVVRMYELFGPTMPNGTSPMAGSGDSMGNGGASSSGKSGSGRSGSSGVGYGIDLGGGYTYTGPPPSMTVDYMNNLLKNNYFANDYGSTIAKLKGLSAQDAHANIKLNERNSDLKKESEDSENLENETAAFESCVSQWVENQKQTAADSSQTSNFNEECKGLYNKIKGRIENNQLVSNSRTDSTPEYQPDAEGQKNYIELSQYSYKSSHRDELNDIRTKFQSSKTYDVEHYRAKEAGMRALKEADQSYGQNKNDEGDFFKESAFILGDIVTDVLPVTGFVKDFYRAWTGYDVTYGNKLSSTERAFSGVFAVANLATLGGAGLVKAPIAALAKMAKATFGEIRVAEEILHASQKLGTKVHVMIPGTSGQTVVLGQRMGRIHALADEIKNAANTLGKEGIVVHTFEESRPAKDFITRKGNELGRRLTDAELMESPSFAENRIWIERMLNEGHSIVMLEDIKHPSVFVDMEIDTIKKYLKGLRNR
jgi:hypothetical protein